MEITFDSNEQKNHFPRANHVDLRESLLTEQELVEAAAQTSGLDVNSFVREAALTAAKRALSTAVTRSSVLTKGRSRLARRGIKGIADPRIAEAYEKIQESGETVTATRLAAAAVTAPQTATRWLATHHPEDLPNYAASHATRERKRLKKEYPEADIRIYDDCLTDAVAEGYPNPVPIAVTAFVAEMNRMKIARNKTAPSASASQVAAYRRIREQLEASDFATDVLLRYDRFFRTFVQHGHSDAAARAKAEAISYAKSKAEAKSD